MSRNKSKIVKWEYMTKPFDVYASTEQIKRLHSSPCNTIKYRCELGGFGIHLRPCVQGLDENGAVVKFLYCTRDGRFFVRGRDGWNEVLPNTNFMRRGFGSKASGGGFDAPRMRDFGHKYCHRCVAVAWCNPPEEALAEINDKDAKKKWEVDHLNTDHKNWTTDNLQWVTVEENSRRKKISNRLKNKVGINPKILSPTLLRGIFGLPEEYFGEFVSRYLKACSKSATPMDVCSIRFCVAVALDNVRRLIDLNEN